MQSNFGWPARVLAATIAVLSLAAMPATAVVLTSNGFEYTANPNRQFVGGNLAGQQGWLGDDPLIDTDPSSTAVIVDTESASGTQSLEVTRMPNSDRRWAKPVTGLPTGQHIVISWDQKVELTFDDSVYGPLLGVEAWDGNSDLLALIGSVFVDGSTGDVIYQEANTGFVTDSGLDVVDEEWTHFQMILDFDLEKYTVHMQRQADPNPVLVVTEDFVDKNLGTGIDAFTDADIAAIAGHPDSASQAATGVAWFDNFMIHRGLFAGDFNGDDVVDARDYVLWRNSHGNVGLTQAADGNGDGLVNELDYEIWKADYVASQPGALVLSPSQVPEPATLGLVFLAAGALAWRFRRV